MHAHAYFLRIETENLSRRCSQSVTATEHTYQFNAINHICAADGSSELLVHVAANWAGHCHRRK